MSFIDWNHLLTLISINAIAALGFYVTLSSGQLSMCHGALFALGGYFAGLVSLRFNLPVVACLAVGFVAAAIPGYLLALVTTKLRDLYFTVATFGFGGAIVELIGHLDFLNGHFGLGGIDMYTDLPLAAGMLALTAFGVWYWDRSLNYQIAAVTRNDQDSALVLGVNVREVRRSTFALGAGIAGLAGALYVGSTTIIMPHDGKFEISLAFLLMVVIGGSQSWRGALVGAALWTALPELLRFASAWRLIIFGAIAILLMAVRPKGIVGRGRGTPLFSLFKTRGAEGRVKQDA